MHGQEAIQSRENDASLSGDHPAESVPSRLRIQHVIGSFQIGGAERYALQLASRQAREGHDVHVVALAEGPLVEVFRDAGVTLHTLPKLARLDPTLPARLASLFVRNGVDVVHTHNPPPLVYASLAARSVGAVLVHTKHGVNQDRQRRMWLRRVLASLAHRIVAVSDDTANHAIRQGEVGADRVHVIRSGVDTDLFRPSRDARERMRTELGIGPDEWVIGSVGRLVPEKNHASLVRACAPLLRDGNARLLLVGEGPERAAIEALVRKLGIEKKVRLAGVRQDTHEVLAAMDVFALSSRTEGMPLALLEAMATELPVVCTRVGGIPTLLAGSDAGALVSSEDDEALAEELRRLQADPEEARRMGVRARQLVTAQHGMHVVTRETTALYARVMREAERSRSAQVIRAVRSVAA